MLVDSHGRAMRYLRLSVTDRCNLRCMYCNSADGYRLLSHDHVLRYEELLRVVRIMNVLGIERVRLTGGEPFARKGCDNFLVSLRQQFPKLDLCITSNGTLLEPYIPLFKKIKVSTVNLSLDSFDRETFAKITGKDNLSSVLTTLEELLNVGINVKINAVAMRGFNDGQIDDFVNFAKNFPVDVRFIEFMPMGHDTVWDKQVFWPAPEIKAAIEKRVRLIKVERLSLTSGPARMYAIEGGRGRIGIISQITGHCCNTCNRLRLTSEGNLRTCLFDDREYALRPLLRNPRIDDTHIMRVITSATQRKPMGNLILERQRQGRAVAEKSMVGIGG